MYPPALTPFPLYRSVARLSAQRLRVGGSRCDLDVGDVIAAYIHKKDDNFKVGRGGGRVGRGRCCWKFKLFD